MTSIPIGVDEHGNTVWHTLRFAPLPIPRMPRAFGKSNLIEQIIREAANEGTVVHYLDLKAPDAGPRRTVRITHRSVRRRIKVEDLSSAPEWVQQLVKEHMP